MGLDLVPQHLVGEIWFLDGAGLVARIVTPRARVPRIFVNSDLMDDILDTLQQTFTSATRMFVCERRYVTNLNQIRSLILSDEDRVLFALTYSDLCHPGGA